METTAGKRTAKQGGAPMDLKAIEAKFEPCYIVEGETVVLFRSRTWAK